MSTYVDIFKTFSKFIRDGYVLNTVQAASLLADQEVRFSVHQAGQDTDRVLCPCLLRYLLPFQTVRWFSAQAGYWQAVYRQTVR